MKLHYKIVSHSSQDPLSPVTNLVLGNGVWQSSRFCQYPQQITIQFYQPVTISSIHIASHNCKISSKIHVLFCLHQSGKMGASVRFQKYGFFQFSDNVGTDFKMREMKKLEEINVNASYMRLILWKNHQNQQNFFNQIGLSHLTVYGAPYLSPSVNTLPPALSNKSGLMNISISEYIETKLQVLEQFKQQFSKQDDFENAKKVKEIIKVIKNHGEKLKALDLQKKNAVGGEQYDKAKLIKTEMEDLKSDVEFVINNFYDHSKKSINPVLKDTKLKVRVDQILSSGGNGSMHESRVSTKLKKVEMEILKQQKQVLSGEEQQKDDNAEQQQEQQEENQAVSRVSYENRIIPAVLHKNKRESIAQNNAQYQDNEFLQKSPKNDQQIVLQQMTPSAEVNAAVMLQIYDKQIVKKLHSKHWNFKLQALNSITQETKKWLSNTGELEKNRVKSVLFTFNRIIKQGNFQLNNLNLNLLLELVGSKKVAGKNVQVQLHAELQKSINQLFLRVNDSQKIKQKTHQILAKMLLTDLYGTAFVYAAISKSYFNQSLTHNVKIKKEKLTVVDNILQQFGIGSKNGLPLSAVDFVCKAAEDTNDEVRKQATAILKSMKQKGAANKVIQVVRSKQSLKGSIIKQLQA